LRYLISKIPNTEKDWKVAQVVEHLLSKREALSSNPSTTKNVYIDIDILMNTSQIPKYEDELIGEQD
jgi:hypothetical protein